MRARLDPFSFLVVSIAGWLNQRQRQVIEYLVEENRVLRGQIGPRRLRFTDNQPFFSKAVRNRVLRSPNQTQQSPKDEGQDTYFLPCAGLPKGHEHFTFSTARRKSSA